MDGQPVKLHQAFIVEEAGIKEELFSKFILDALKGIKELQ